MQEKAAGHQRYFPILDLGQEVGLIATESQIGQLDSLYRTLILGEGQKPGLLKPMYQFEEFWQEVSRLFPDTVQNQGQHFVRNLPGLLERLSRLKNLERVEQFMDGIHQGQSQTQRS